LVQITTAKFTQPTPRSDAKDYKGFQLKKIVIKLLEVNHRIKT